MANVAPAGRTAIRKVPEAVPRLQTLIVETTALVEVGTVYSVVSVVALGAL
jgi:F0F1-type ATP synthase membrane subunit c/vacuolar-type H+-ATPase subunit K